MAIITENIPIELPDLEQDATTVALQKIVRALITIVDHNHDVTKGRKVPSPRIDFNGEQDVNNNLLKNVKSLSFKGDPLPDNEEHPIKSLYIRDNDLWFKTSTGHEIQLTQNNSVNNPLINIDAGSPSPIFWGWTGVQNQPSNNQAVAKAAALNSFSFLNNRNQETVNNLFLGGLLFTGPAPPGGCYYWLWAAIRQDDSNNLRVYTDEYENDTVFWVPVTGNTYDATISIGNPPKNVNFKLFVRINPIPSGKPGHFIFRNFYGTGGIITQ